MRLKPSTNRERNAARTIIALERLVADSTTAPKMRRAATLRLGRLRAANRPAITTRAKPAAPAPSEEAKFEAAQSFAALARQRTALFRNRRRTQGEQEAFNAMVCLMPATMPPDNDPKAWTNFVAQIGGLLSEIKTIKHL
jgi:hypothetical protein